MQFKIGAFAQLGQALQAARKKKSLTQKEAGNKVGLLPKTISALESTPEKATVASLMKLLSALDLEMVLQEKTGNKGLDW